VVGFGVATLLILFSELNPLDADDSLDNNETVSLKAESLSGLSVLDDSLVLSVVVTVLEIVEFVPDTIELDREWVLVRVLNSPFCSSRLNSFRIESNSDSCVSSKFAIENR
jgi:preprotein translocase subunit Sec63